MIQEQRDSITSFASFSIIFVEEMRRPGTHAAQKVMLR